MLARINRYVNRSLNRRLLIFMVPFVVVLLVAVTTLSFWSFFRTLRAEKEQSTRTLVAQIGSNFNYMLGDIKTLMAFISTNKDLLQALTEWDSLSPTERYFLNSRIVDATSNVNVFKPYINDIIIVGRNGYLNNLPHYYRLATTANLLESPWLKEYQPARNSRFHFTPAHQADYYESNAPVALVVSSILPVIDQGRVMGYLQGDIDHGAMYDLLDAAYQQNAIQVTVATPDGIVVFDREPSLINTNIDADLLEQLRGVEGSFVLSGDQGNNLITYLRSDATDWWLIASVPYAALLNPGYAVSRTILLVILPIGLAVALGTLFVLNRQFKRPWSRLVERIENVDVDNYTPVEIDYGVSEVADLAEKFESMVAQSSDLIKRVYVAEIKKKDAELASLRQQVAPHFIYNSLQVIKADAILASNRQLGHTVNALANLLRYAMDNRSTCATVADELAYIRDYLDIYVRRFGDRFTYTIDVPASLYGLRMQKMILQPLVENSIKHGFEQTKTGGLIRIRGGQADEVLWFLVEDNGTGIVPERLERLRESLLLADDGKSGCIGLSNVHQRIAMECGEGTGIVAIESELHCYTRIVVHVRPQQIST